MTDYGPRYGWLPMWIFTLGEPEPDLMTLLGESIKEEMPNWVVVPIHLGPMVDAFPHTPGKTPVVIR